MEKLIKVFLNNVIRMYHEQYDKSEIIVKEITDDVLTELVTNYLTKFKTLDEAYKYVSDYSGKLTKDTYDDINFKDEDGYMESPEYKQWQYYLEIRQRIYTIMQYSNYENAWVNINGKAHTDDEASKIAANKWCDIIFKPNLKDNGALDQKTSFSASLLSSCVGNEVKEKLSDDIKVKTHDLLCEFYKHALDHNSDWLRENIPSEDIEKFNWSWVKPVLSCDYHPDWQLYTILYNAGVEKKDIDWICPWKTTISIGIDNTVYYRNHSKEEKL